MKKTIALLLVVFLFALASCSKKLKKGQFLFTVPACTMEPNLFQGMVAVIDSTAHQFDYGDIVLIKQHIMNLEYLRLYRVVGLPTDSIAIDNSICVINGVKNPYQFVKEVVCDNQYIETFPNGVSVSIYRARCYPDSEEDSIPNIYVPANHYFLMADNRPNIDSRKFGSVPSVGILGKYVKFLIL